MSVSETGVLFVVSVLCLLFAEGEEDEEKEEEEELKEGTSFNGGEGGIRTHGRLLHLQRFSKAPLSTTQPPHR